jgi:hypothetical protein
MCRCGQASPAELKLPKGCKSLNGRRNVALAGDRRRANEEANLPLAGNNDWLGLGRGSSQLHDDDDGSSGGNWRDRVHGDAELAMIGIALAWVQVRDLSNGERGQKDETQDGDSRQKAKREATSSAASCALWGAAFAAENCSESCHGACQPLGPSTSILQKAYRSLDAMGAGRLHRSYNSETSRSKKRQSGANV